MINIFFEDVKTIGIEHLKVDDRILKVIKNEKKVCGEISFIFCSDEYLLKINKQFLGHDFYTDVITFSYCEDEILSGDIFISIDRVQENANGFHVSFENELLRVMIHGVLHLIGYNDETEDEESFMHKMEDKYLAC